MLCGAYLVLVLGVLNNSPNTGYLTWIKTFNHVMLLKQKHVSTLPFYVAIINGTLPNWPFKKKQQTHTIWRLKIILSCMAWLGQHQKIFNTIPLVHIKLETVTHLDIIFLDGQVMYIHYKKKIHVIHSIFQL